MFKSECTIIFCIKMYVKVRIHTKMYELMFINPQQYTIIYENIRTYTKTISTMYVNVQRKTNHYDKGSPHTKLLHVKLFFQNPGFSYEKLRITANNRNKLRKAKTTCEFPIRTLTYPKSRKWDRALRSIIQP